MYVIPAADLLEFTVGRQLLEQRGDHGRVAFDARCDELLLRGRAAEQEPDPHRQRLVLSSAVHPVAVPWPESEVIRAIMLEDSPCLLHGLR